MKRQYKQSVKLNGGIAIPLGNNYFYMKGRKHSTGGIDVDKNLEVEDGEIVHAGKKSTKVYSSLPFLNGISPVEKLLGGQNPNKVFAEQERFKDKHGINDDGTMKKKAFVGTQIFNDNAQLKRDNKNKTFEEWYKTVPKEINDTTNYNLKLAYEKLPFNELELWRNGKGHLRSVILNKDGNYEFLKSKHHPTYNKEIDWYNSNDAKEFRNNYYLDDSSKYPKYIRKNNNSKAMGGETKRRGLYSVTSNGQTKLYSYPSTGSETQNNRVVAQVGTEYNNKKELPPAFRHLGIIYNQYKKIKGEDKNENKSKSNNVNVDKRIKLDNFDFPELTYNSPYINKYGINANKQATKVDSNKTQVNATKVMPKNNTIINNKSSNNTVNTKVDSNKTQVVKVSPNKTKNNKIKKSDITFDMRYNPLTKNEYNTYTNSTDRLTAKDLDPKTFNNIDKIDTKYTKRNEKNKSNWWNNKVKPWFKDSNNVADTIGLTSNFAGNLAAALINKKALDNMKYTDVPIPKVAAKLKTNYNINPALNSLREDLAAYNRNVDYNTESSQVALNRKRHALANSMDTSNKLYALKENEQTKLINADKLNQQGVANENIDTYNNWMKEKTNFDNTIREKRAENVVGFMNNFNLGIQDILTRRENRRKDLADASLVLAAHPHVNTELLERFGVNIFGNKFKPKTTISSNNKVNTKFSPIYMPKLSEFKPDYKKVLRPGIYD